MFAAVFGARRQAQPPGPLQADPFGRRGGRGAPRGGECAATPRRQGVQRHQPAGQENLQERTEGARLKKPPTEGVAGA
eukprot:2380939-Pyramimonas_sp.AAC.1